jgi:hypothetical protein
MNTTSANITESVKAATPDLSDKDISGLARIIRADWKKPNYAAVPYLDAMRTLGKISGAYGHDSGREIILRFLGNASTWRGETAKAVKAELKKRLAAK